MARAKLNLDWLTVQHFHLAATTNTVCKALPCGDLLILKKACNLRRMARMISSQPHARFSSTLHARENTSTRRNVHSSIRQLSSCRRQNSLHLAINSANEQRLRFTLLSIISKSREARQLASNELLVSAHNGGTSKRKADDINSAVRWAICVHPGCHIEYDVTKNGPQDYVLRIVDKLEAEWKKEQEEEEQERNGFTTQEYYDHFSGGDVADEEQEPDLKTEADSKKDTSNTEEMDGRLDQADPRTSDSNASTRSSSKATSDATEPTNVPRTTEDWRRVLRPRTPTKAPTRTDRTQCGRAVRPANPTASGDEGDQAESVEEGSESSEIASDEDVSDSQASKPSSQTSSDEEEGEEQAQYILPEHRCKDWRILSDFDCEDCCKKVFFDCRGCMGPLDCWQHGGMLEPDEDASVWEGEAVGDENFFYDLWDRCEGEPEDEDPGGYRWSCCGQRGDDEIPCSDSRPKGHFDGHR